MCSANFSLQQGVLALPWPRDVALREDALTLLRSLPNGSAALVCFDPQYRGVLDKLRFGRRSARRRQVDLKRRNYGRKCGGYFLVEINS